MNLSIPIGDQVKSIRENAIDDIHSLVRISAALELLLKVNAGLLIVSI
jgi:hypothetical protein